MKALLGTTPQTVARRWSRLDRLVQLDLGRDRFAETPGPTVTLSLGERTHYRADVSIHDEFRRAPGLLGSAYTPWVTPAGFEGLVITSSGVVGPADLGAPLARFETHRDLLPREQWASLQIVDLASEASAGASSVGLLLRGSPPNGTGRGYLVMIDRTLDAIWTRVHRYRDGTVELLDEVETPWKIGEVLAASADWATVRVYRHGVLILEVFDADPLLVGGRAGVAASLTLSGDAAALTNFLAGPLRQEYVGLLADVDDVVASLGLLEPTATPMQFGMRLSNLGPIAGAPRVAALIRHGQNTGTNTYDWPRSEVRVLAAFAGGSAPVALGHGLVEQPAAMTEESLRLECQGRDAFLTPLIEPGEVIYLPGGMPTSGPAPLPDDPCEPSPTPDEIPGDPPDEVVDPPPDEEPEEPEEPTEPDVDPFPGIYYVYTSGADPDSDDADYNTSLTVVDANVVVNHTGQAADYLEPLGVLLYEDPDRVRTPDKLGFTYRDEDESPPAQIPLDDSVMIAGLNSVRFKKITVTGTSVVTREHGRTRVYFYRALADLPGTHIDIAVRKMAFVTPLDGDPGILSRYPTYRAQPYGPVDHEVNPALREDGWLGTGRVVKSDGVESEGWPYGANECVGSWPPGHPESPNAQLYDVFRHWECPGTAEVVEEHVGFMCVPTAYSGGAGQWAADALGSCPPTPTGGGNPCDGLNNWIAGYRTEAVVFNPALGGTGVLCNQPDPGDPAGAYICPEGPDGSYNILWSHAATSIVVNLRAHPDPATFEDLETLDVNTPPTEDPLNGTIGPTPESNYIESLADPTTGGPLPTSSSLEYDIVTFEIGDARFMSMNVEVGNSLANPSTGAPQSEDGLVVRESSIEIWAAILRVYTP